MRVVKWVVGPAAILALLWAGRRVLVASHVEEPAYRVLGEQGGLELREYEPTIVAVTEVEGGFRESLEEGFRRLAGYIFGGNRPGEDISMTAPVAMQRHPSEGEGERIAMTAPVSARREGQSWRITFVMPAEYTLETLPRPLDERVRLEPVPARKVAVLRFSGRATEEEAEARMAELRERLSRQGLRATGEPVLAQYNPPWTPPFLRRNEILVPVE
ncbi:MAG TPA: heme-binding protein [Myxococcaceae bacterium]|nr:heme-binding protein [Myxococcaceae bacterium]